MFDFENENNDESRLKIYQQNIARRKNQKSFLANSYIEDSYPSSTNADYSLQESSGSELTLKLNVDDKIDVICEIDEEFKKALELAQLANKRAKRAKSYAEEAKKKSTRFGKRKVAIEALQESGYENAISNQSNSEAITKIAMLQQRIIEATKALFSLGVSNIAANRSVYRQLELRMKGASEQELSDFARNEVLAVMQQLNEQQDVMAKQNKLSEKVHEHNDLLKNQAAAIEALELEGKNQKAEIEKLKLENEKQKEQFQAYFMEQNDKSQKEESESEKHETEEIFTDKDESSAAYVDDEEKSEPTKEKNRWFQKKR